MAWKIMASAKAARPHANFGGLFVVGHVRPKGKCGPYVSARVERRHEVARRHGDGHRAQTEADHR